MVLIAILAYLLATGLLLRSASRPRLEGGHGWRWVAAAAALLHLGYHAQVAWRTPGGPDLHFYSALSLVGLGMAAMTAFVGAGGRMRALGVVVFPLSAVVLLLYVVYGHRSAPEPHDWRLLLHAWMALLGYATLAVSAVLAVFLWLQERALRRREFHSWLRALPPLTELESLLFRSITVGFGLLTATLLTGLLFVEDMLAQHLVHKTVLSVLSWLLFGGLLLGRWRYGWRGIRAVHWTLAAMALLLLAFFGSKFVLEMVLAKV